MSTQIPDGDSSRASMAAPALLTVDLSPARVEMEPGGSPVEVVLTLHNLSNVVEQYTVEVSGLEADWFTTPVTSLSLFPQDRDQVRISLHAPKRPGFAPIHFRSSLGRGVGLPIRSPTACSKCGASRSTASSTWRRGG